MKIKNFRWWIIGLISLATLINYLDRQSLPIAIGELRKSFAISDVDYGLINSLFLFAYGTMYAVGGRLLDILGTKKGYGLMIIWWSVASMLQAAVYSVFGLGLVRFLLGIGEGGAFPGSAKGISEWFPVKERAVAFGIFNSGSSLGAILAPPLISLIIAGFNWRWAFIICGATGLLWVIAWFKIYSGPFSSKFITKKEKKYLQEDSLKTSGEQIEPDSFRKLFGCTQVWNLLLVKFLTDAAWFFFIFWLPKYLSDVRGLDIKSIGAYAWIPYAFAGLGSLSGGWLSSYLLKTTGSLDKARKIPLGMAACLLPFSLLIFSASLNMSIVLFSIAMLGHQLWSTIIQTLPTDIFPSKNVGSISGLMGCAGTYGAMIFSYLVGQIVTEYGYHPAFIGAGILHPISFILILLLLKKIEPVSQKTVVLASKQFI